MVYGLDFPYFMAHLLGDLIRTALYLKISLVSWLNKKKTKYTEPPVFFFKNSFTLKARRTAVTQHEQIILIIWDLGYRSFKQQPNNAK